MRKVLILCSLILLLSCSIDDSDNDLPPDPYILEAIIGSWAYDQITVNSEVFLYQHTEGCNKDLFQFYNQEGKEFDFEEKTEDYFFNQQAKTLTHRTLLISLLITLNRSIIILLINF